MALLSVRTSVVSLVALTALLLACDGSDDGAIARKKGDGSSGASGTTKGGSSGTAKGGASGNGAGAGSGSGSGSAGTGTGSAGTGSGSAGTGSGSAGSGSGSAGSGSGSAGSGSGASGGSTGSSGGASSGSAFSATRSRVSITYTPGKTPFPSEGNAAFPGPGAVVSGCVSKVVGPCVVTDCPEDAKPIGSGAQAVSTGDIEVSGQPENLTITFANDDAGYNTRLGVLGWKGGEKVPFDSLGSIDLAPIHGSVVAPPLLVFAQPATLVGDTFGELDTSKPLVIKWTGAADAAISARFGIQKGGFVDALLTPHVISCVLAGQNNTATIGTEVLALLPKEKSLNVEIASFSGATTSVAGRVVDLALYGAPFRTFADIK